MSRVWITRLIRAGGVATLSLVCFFAGGCDDNGDGTPARWSAAPATHAEPVSVPVRNGFVRPPSAIHPYARPEDDRGRLDPAQRIENLSLFFKLSPEQRGDRDALALAQVDVKSPEYRHWLTPEQYAGRFGARPEDISRASAWLRAQGFNVHRTSRLGTRVTFSGKVGDLESAFQTEMHYYVVRGETHYAMATPPAFPPDLADVVLGLHNTHDFYPRPVSGTLNRAATARAAGTRYDAPEAGLDGGSVDVLGPPDWAAAYDVAKLYDPGIGGQKLDGSGVTIGIVGTAEIAQGDVDAFRKTFNLPASKVTMTLVPDTGAAAGGRFGDGVEAILDVEWSGGVAKGATVNYVFVGSSDRNVDDATFYLIEENLAPVVSESYGGCEAGSLPTDADILEENGTAANLMGITYMAAAGDSGADDCGGGPFGSGLYVDMPGSFPGVTAVGGTQFPNLAWNAQGNLQGYPSLEQVWNEGNDPYSQFGVGAGGGGISSVFARPAYLNSISTCAPVGSLPVAENPSTMRQVPDVALSAASATPGYFVECTFLTSGDCSATGGMPQGFPIGGTSAASPSFAGVVAILNQAVGERLGNINPLLYALKAHGPAASPFHDITSGNNEVACGDEGAGDAGGPGDAGWPDAGCGEGGLFGYAATTGYDCASGLGSIDAFNLVSAVIGISKTTTSLVASPVETTEGADVTLTATVNTVGVNPNALGGSVTFTFESFTETGEIDLSWELGTVAVSGGSTGTAHADLTTPIPPGLVKPGHQWVDVIAVYGGDADHLSSASPKVGVGFLALSFAIDPATLTLQPDQSQTFKTTGGIPPVRWFVNQDTTHGRTDAGFGAASIDETSGDLTVGPKAGYVEIAALDKYGAEALAYITVGSPTTAVPWADDAGPFLDAGVAPLVDSGPQMPNPPSDSGAQGDAEKPDAGSPELLAKGCTCELTGARSSGRAGPLGVIGGLIVGLGVIGCRRRIRSLRGP